MKKLYTIFSLLLAALLLLGVTGCGKKPADPASASSGGAAPSSAGSGSRPSPEPSDAQPEPSAPARSPTDCDSRFRLGQTASVTEWDGVFYFLVGEYVGYYDEASGESGILCGRPECTHEDWTCNAYMNDNAKSLFWYDGKLYWMGFDQQYLHVKGVPANRGIWRMEPDGTGRELLKLLPDEIKKLAVASVTFHRGNAYLLVREERVTDGVPESLFWIYRTKLDRSEEFTPLLCRSEGLLYQVVDHYIYIAAHADPGDRDTPPHNVEISRYDLDTGEEELLLSPENAVNITAGCFCVTDDQTVYVADWNTNTHTDMLYRLENGRLEPIPGTKDETGTYSVWFLAGELAYRNHQNEDGSLTVWVSDLDGKTLFCGVSPQDFRGDDAGPTPLPVARTFLGGEKHFFLVYYMGIADRKGCVVRYDVLPEGLSETDLWSMTGR